MSAGLVARLRLLWGRLGSAPLVATEENTIRIPAHVRSVAVAEAVRCIYVPQHARTVNVP